MTDTKMIAERTTIAKMAITCIVAPQRSHRVFSKDEHAYCCTDG